MMNNKFIEHYLHELSEKGFFEAVGVGISIQDTNLKILYQNNVHKSLVGEHIGEYCYQAYEKRASECEGCPLLVTFKDGVTHTSERMVRINGGISYFEITSSPIKDKTGEIIAGIEIIRDITQRKRDAEALKTSEEKFRMLFSTEQDAIIMVESETRRIVDANDSVLRLYGYSKEEILNLTGPDLSAEPEKSKGVIEEIAMSTDKGGHYHTRNHKKKDGTVFPVEISSGVFILKGKKIISAIIRDITERKNVEDQLKEREQYLQSIINTEPECVKIILSDGTIVQMNPAGLKMIEADSIEQVIGKSVYPIIVSKHQNAFRELTESVCLGNQGLLEFEIIGLKGTHRWLETHAVPLRSAKNEIIGLLGVTRDITEHKKSLEKIKQLNEELGQILYATSHDLRSPLVNIDGYSKELDYSFKEFMSAIENVHIPSNIKEKINSIVKDDIPESLHYIKTSVFKMNTLLKGILTLSRLERYKLTIEEIDMNEMIMDIVDNHRFKLNELRIKTEVSKLPNCKGDSSQINQVFSNLLDNAIKYSDSERSCVINISGYKDNNQSVYCIDDNGHGIAPEHQDKIFEMFYQLEPYRVKGEGMGLTIINRIIEKHNGKIWVESELSKGSKFFVSLPS
jgi:PAS domain S-box-containing protein